MLHYRTVSAPSIVSLSVHKLVVSKNCTFCWHYFFCHDSSRTQRLPKQLKLPDFIMDMECVLCEVGIVFVCVCVYYIDPIYIQGVLHKVCKTSGCYHVSHFLVKMLCQHMPLYQLLCCYRHFNISRFCTLSVVSFLINHLHVYFNIWQMLLPRRPLWRVQNCAQQWKS
jgi:hypothetical protein